MKEPTLFESDWFKSDPIKKAVSGGNHTLFLSQKGKVFASGESESGRTGRIIKSRNRFNQELKIEQVGAKNAVDIFCGAHCSWYLDKEGRLFGFGLNTKGQLGIGHTDNMAKPTLVYELKG